MSEKQVLDSVVAEAIRTVFSEYVEQHGLEDIAQIFSKGVKIEVGDMLPSENYEKLLRRVPPVWDRAFEVNASENAAIRASCVEFVLAGLYATDRISRAQRHGVVHIRNQLIEIGWSEIGFSRPLAKLKLSGSESCPIGRTSRRGVSFMLPFSSYRPGGDLAFRARRHPIVWLWCLVFLGTSFCLSCPAQEEKAEPPRNPFPQAVPVPEGILDGGTEWLNTGEPISLRQLRGKIVLLDFWTYCCINCMHVLPDLEYLEEKYGAQLVVIGVHSAKFDNEKDSENIRNAIMRYEIRHPVVNDSEMQIWRKFGTQAWPTLALIDPEGNYVGSQSGEGNRELFDLVIGKLVEYHRWKGTLDETPLVFKMESDKAQPTPLRFPGKVLADAASGRVFISTAITTESLWRVWMGSSSKQLAPGEWARPMVGLRKRSLTIRRHGSGWTTTVCADTENHLIRVVNLETKQVATLAGTVGRASGNSSFSNSAHNRSE